MKEGGSNHCLYVNKYQITARRKKRGWGEMMYKFIFKMMYKGVLCVLLILRFLRPVNFTDFKYTSTY